MENLNDLMGVESPQEMVPITAQNADNAKQSTESKGENSRSQGLVNTANIFNVLMYICLSVAVIAGLVYLSNIGDAEYRTRAANRCVLAASWFSAGVGGAFSSYIVKSLFSGLSVIAEAAEKYLNQK